MPASGQNLHPPFYRLQFAARSLRTPHWLGFSLFAASLYAACAQGAIRTPQEPRLQVGVAVIATLAAALGLWSDTLTLAAPKAARAALALMLAFCAWSALTLAWSISPDGTWVEVNRVFSYTLILGLALALGASDQNAVRHTGRGVFALTLIVLLYALGQKVIPGVHIAGLIDLNRTGQFARLEAPLDDWNALALLLSLGAPVALTTALGPTGGRAGRVTGLITLELIVVAIGFTESRGGFVAVAVALGATVLLSPDRLTALAWAGSAVAVGLVDLIISLSAHPLTRDGVGLGRRELAGVLLLGVLLATTTLSALLIPSLDRLGSRLTPRTRQSVRRAIGTAGLAAVAAAIGAASLSHRGLTGQVSRIWAGFNRADSIATSSPSRLLSDSSANRVDWWGQALTALVHRPLDGYGAGSFAVINTLFRHNTVSVQDAHSVPLQWLAETGLVGFGLALAAWLLLVRQGLKTVRGTGTDRGNPLRSDAPAARHRLAAIALLAPALAYSVHALFDWDWDIPGVTLPVLIMLGVLAGSAVHPTKERPTIVEAAPPVTTRREPGPTLKLIGLALLTAIAALFAVSAVLPGVAATKANLALAEAAGGTPAALSRARHEASFASALDPLSGAGPLASANIALADHADRLARSDVIEAIRRQPTDETAWATLAQIDLGLNRDAEAIRAAQHALAVDPEIGQVGELTLAADVIAAEVAAAPPQSSVTHTPTPGA